ncbi:MAG: cytochrome c oxidase subunit 3 [Acidobacteriota bacterium]
MPLLSDRAGKTAEVVVLPSSTEDPAKAPPGLLRFGLILTLASISAFFIALVIAYYWRKSAPGIWDQIALPNTLWISTAIILVSSGVFEAARRTYARGMHEMAARLLLVTGCLGLAFLAAQTAAWRALVAQGAYIEQNPYSGFFYLFTGLHAAHLVGGLVVLAFVILSRSPRRELVDCAAYYWHFLGVLWIALFVVLSH